MKNKRVIIFDMDGTLAESKQPLEAEMAELLGRLLEKYQVAVISGAAFAQFEKQFLAWLPQEAARENLFIFPASGSAAWFFQAGEWQEVYAEVIAPTDRERIKVALQRAQDETGLAESTIFGEQIEDRLSQITWSGLGSEAPLAKKAPWDPDQEKRREMIVLLEKDLPEFSVKSGGTTSIDITKKGIDKAYGVRKISELLEVPLAEMLFVGDAIYEGGNDYPAITTGVDYEKVANVAETKELIKELI